MRIVLACALLALSAQAQAFPAIEDDWVPYGVTTPGETYYWMIGKTKWDSGSNPIVWIIADKRPTANANLPAARRIEHTMQRLIVDCKEETLRSMAVYAYNFDGGVVDSDTTPQPTSKVPPPGSLGSHLVETVCRAVDSMRAKPR